jgi:hypothetical protein
MAGKIVILKKLEHYNGLIRVIVTVYPNCGRRLMNGMTKCPECGSIIHFKPSIDL